MLIMCSQRLSLTPSLSLTHSRFHSPLRPLSVPTGVYFMLHKVEVTTEKCWQLNLENLHFDKCIKYVWQLLDTMGVQHVTSNVPITYYFPSVHNMYMYQGLSIDCSNIGFCV